MKISVKLTGIFTLHLLCLTLGPLAEGTSRCTAPATELTKEATVTCIFPVNVSMSKTDFTVYHEKEKVAECIWIQGRPDCTLKPGYEQDNQLDTKHFTLRIPRFLQNHTGRYSCDVTGYNKEECTLFQRTVPATSRGPARHTVSTLVPLISSEDGTSNDDKATSTVLIIVVPTVGVCLAVASAAVVVYVVYKCVGGKTSPSKPDDVPTVQTGRRDAKKSCDTPPIERQPTPESTAGHQANVTTNLSETDDRSKSSEHRYTCNLQQEQIDSPFRKDCECDHVTHTPVPGRTSTPRNYWRCSRHDLSQGCVKSRGHDACGVCGRCGPTGEHHVTKATEDSADDDEHCIDEHTCHKLDRLGTSEDLSKCFERYLHLLETRVLHEEFLKKIPGKHVTSELSKDAMPSNGDEKMFPGIQMREAQPSPVQ